MVQRTRLALILLLLLGSIIYLNAQESGFVPPSLVSEASVHLPANFTQYDPPRALIMVRVMPDSSATLVRILDNKPDLVKYIQETMPQWEFIPASLNNTATDATLTFNVQLLYDLAATAKSTSTAQADSVSHIDKEKLLKWINDRRLIADTNNIFPALSGNLPNPAMLQPYYHINGFLYGLNDSYLTMKDGAIEPERLYSQSYEYQQMLNFREASVEEQIISFDSPVATKSDSVKVRGINGEEVYHIDTDEPEQVLITDVYAGLGDYEFNIARALIRKGQAFGVKNLYIDAGFLAQNGTWQGVLCPQSSMRLNGSYEFKRYILSASFENYHDIFPASQLTSAWQSGQQTALKHLRQDYAFMVKSPYGKVIWRDERESIAANVLNQRIVAHNAALVYNNDWHIRSNEITLTYQYNAILDTLTQQYIYNYNHKDRHELFTNIKGNLIFDSTGCTYNLQGLLTPHNLSFASFKTQYLINPANVLSLRFHTADAKATHSTAVPSIYDTTSLLLPTIHEKHRASVAWESMIELHHNTVRFQIEPGIHTLRLYSPSDSLHLASHDVTKPYVQGYASFDIPIVDNWKLNLNQIAVWHATNRSLYELPAFTWQSRLKVNRELPYDNALSAGITLMGHTDFYLANEANTRIYTAAVMDVWAALRITRLFEIQLACRNLGDNTLFGVKNSPRTLMANVHWFFLN